MGLDNPIHIAFLLILLLLVFGAKRLPEMGRSLGSGMRGFKDAISGENSQPTSGENSQPTLTAQQEPTPAVVGTQTVAPDAVATDAPVAAEPALVAVGTPEIPEA